MKFRLTKEHLYSWPVVINPPDPDRPGHVLEQQFNMTFRAQPRDEGRAMAAEIDALPEAEQSLRQDDLLRSVCRGWDNNVVDEDGQPVPFSPAALEQMLMFPFVRIGIYRAYSDSQIGQGAQKGN